MTLVTLQSCAVLCVWKCGTSKQEISQRRGIVNAKGWQRKKKKRKTEKWRINFQRRKHTKPFCFALKCLKWVGVSVVPETRYDRSEGFQTLRNGDSEIACDWHYWFVCEMSIHCHHRPKPTGESFPRTKIMSNNLFDARKRFFWCALLLRPPTPQCHLLCLLRRRRRLVGLSIFALCKFNICRWVIRCDGSPPTLQSSVRMATREMGSQSNTCTHNADTGRYATGITQARDDNNESHKYHQRIKGSFARKSISKWMKRIAIQKFQRIEMKAFRTNQFFVWIVEG